jgi:hypothetical protein
MDCLESRKAPHYFRKEATNGNSISRHSGSHALAGLAGFNQADGGIYTKPPYARPVRRNIE